MAGNQSSMGVGIKSKWQATATFLLACLLLSKPDPSHKQCIEFIRVAVTYRFQKSFTYLIQKKVFLLNKRIQELEAAHFVIAVLTSLQHFRPQSARWNTDKTLIWSIVYMDSTAKLFGSDESATGGFKPKQIVHLLHYPNILAPTTEKVRACRNFCDILTQWSQCSGATAFNHRHEQGSPREREMWLEVRIAAAKEEPAELNRRVAELREKYARQQSVVKFSQSNSPKLPRSWLLCEDHHTGRAIKAVSLVLPSLCL
ncbi:hypothetical protein Pelo_15440 [Pelomyxa schiedti]|nr:hypothetical protein Pelo_15440 [Pelomyxa schiedti]